MEFHSLVNGKITSIFLLFTSLPVGLTLVSYCLSWDKNFRVYTLDKSLVDLVPCSQYSVDDRLLVNTKLLSRTPFKFKFNFV